jgi:hypothetical protein
MERLKRPPTFFASAGINLFGMRLRTMVLSMGDVLQPNEMKELFSVDVDTSVKLKLDGFLSQRVLMFQGEWASRRDVIKYMANIASGVHSSTPSEPAEVLLHKIQRGITYSQRTGVYFNTKITTGIDLPFRYDPDGLDVVLIELMAAASFLVSSDDTARLEDAIRDELRLFQPSSRSRNRSPGS